MENQFQTMPNGGSNIDTRRRQVIIGVLIVLVAIIIGMLLWYRAYRQANTELPVYVPTVSPDTITRIETSTSTYRSATDADLDGIENTDEATLGTSNRDFDTDHDGVSDWDEIHVWKTNPIATDTDLDGFSDGVEIIRGYNPLGKGAL